MRLYDSLRHAFSSDTRLAKGLRVSAFSATCIITIGYFVYLTLHEAPAGPCSREGLPGRCYHVNQNVCENMWHDTDLSCKADIKKLSLAPGRLTGPILKKCKLLRYDRSFSSSRKSNPECTALYNDVKEWGRSNDF